MEARSGWSLMRRRVRRQRRVDNGKVLTRVYRRADLGDDGRVLQLLRLGERGRFVSRVTLLLSEVDVDLDVGHEGVVDGRGHRVYGRRVRGRDRVGEGAIECCCGERVGHRFRPRRRVTVTEG